ncbi:MAG: cytochrome c [Elusimicrobia bacterium]|nr:cytochrome c [Elusimicrobiota bacterium]
MAARVLAVLAFVLGLAAAWGLGGGAGRRIFDSRCATCHGAGGRGAPGMARLFGVPPQNMDLSSAGVQKMTDEDLARTISEGRGPMPPFKGVLGPEQMREVIAHIRSLAAPRKPGRAK